MFLLYLVIYGRSISVVCKRNKLEILKYGPGLLVQSVARDSCFGVFWGVENVGGQLEMGLFGEHFFRKNDGNPDRIHDQLEKSLFI